jgi:hypothetical protein
LTHDVTYGSLLQDRRRTLHRQIVETIERLYPDRLAEHIERLAHHAFRGEAWEKAVTHLRSLSPRSPSPRLSSPLIEPDVTISVIRLSDGFHGRHSQARAAEVGQETERPAPRILP